MRCEEHDYAGAIEGLTKAVAPDPTSWKDQWLLAGSCLTGTMERCAGPGCTIRAIAGPARMNFSISKIWPLFFLSRLKAAPGSRERRQCAASGDGTRQAHRADAPGTRAVRTRLPAGDLHGQKRNSLASSECGHYYHYRGHCLHHFRHFSNFELVPARRFLRERATEKCRGKITVAVVHCLA